MLKLKIVSPEKVEYDGDIESVKVPGTAGEFALRFKGRKTMPPSSRLWNAEPLHTLALKVVRVLTLKVVSFL